MQLKPYFWVTCFLCRVMVRLHIATMNAFRRHVKPGECDLPSKATDSAVPSRFPAEDVPPEGIDAREVIARMRIHYGVKSDAELAERLGTAKATISSWRRRNSVPMESCLKAARDNRITLDRIVLGASLYADVPGSYGSDFIEQMFFVCLYIIDEQKIGAELKSVSERAGKRAAVMWQMFNTLMTTGAQYSRGGDDAIERMIAAMRGQTTRPGS